MYNGIDIHLLLLDQIERCEKALVGSGGFNLKGSMESLFAICPQSVKIAVKNRKSEYTLDEGTDYKLLYDIILDELKRKSY
jgi:hypothetical protein